MGELDEADALISEAIREGAKAGMFWKAARLNPKSEAVWKPYAERYHRQSTALLAEAIKRLA